MCSLASSQIAPLHVIVAATHRFDRTLMETVIRDNINPIEKLERSSLIVASTVHGRVAAELLQPSQVARIERCSPMLFVGGGGDSGGGGDGGATMVVEDGPDS